MISFLFWNIKKNNIGQHIRTIAIENNVDVLALAECEILPAELLVALNKDNNKKYHFNPHKINKKIDIYTRFSSEFMKILLEDHRTTIRQLSLPGSPDLLLAITHYPSKANMSDDEQALECRNLSDLIIEAEKKARHERTILFGDLNMNPFEIGVVSSHGLHAVVSREIAKKRRRVVGKKEYLYFYNPMWNLFGDSKLGPPGTYYFSKSTPIVYFWNIFDQVLIRPDLIKYFEVDKLKIITSNGKGVELINNNGKPNSEEFSDHLPLFFMLNI